MGRYAARRIGQLGVVVLGATLVLFGCLFVLPGDPVAQLAGSERARDPAVVAELRHTYGLDRPLAVQYGRYLAGLARGDLGDDYTQGRPVAEILAPKLARTAELAAAALVLDVVAGLGAGVLAAVRRHSVWDVSVTLVTTVAIGVPSIVLGMLAQRLFVVELGWFPLIPDGGPRSLVLPALTLAAVDAALVAQLARATVLDVLRADHVKTAVAKGLPRRTVLARHVLPNAVVPVVTYLGITFGTLLGGALVTETVFNWDGIGLALITAVQQHDNPVIIGVATVSVAVVTLLNLLVDLLCAALDPRIRLA